MSKASFDEALVEQGPARFRQVKEFRSQAYGIASCSRPAPHRQLSTVRRSLTSRKQPGRSTLLAARRSICLLYADWASMHCGQGVRWWLKSALTPPRIVLQMRLSCLRSPYSSISPLKPTRYRRAVQKQNPSPKSLPMFPTSTKHSDVRRSPRQLEPGFGLVARATISCP